MKNIFKNFKNIIMQKNGQSTVEMAIVFPVVLIIAMIALNAILFFSECASFDRLFKQSVITYAPSPAYGHTLQNIRSDIYSCLEEEFDKDYMEMEVSVESTSGGFVKFKGTLKMYPTLFGLGLKREIFGVPLMNVEHQSEMSVDMYKPGVIF